MRFTLAVSLFVLLLQTPAQAQSWATAPFSAPTPLPRDGLPVEPAAFFSWLSHAPPLRTQEDMQRVSEHVYAYVSVLAKRLRGQFPARTDTAAFTLFRVAASLGIVGADRVARALYSHPEKLPPPAPVPAFRLSLVPPLFHLISDDGSWGVCYPYYFMAAPAGRQRPANGVLTEVVVLSTLFAPDQGEDRSSQATVLIAAAPIADSARHVSTWVTQLAVTPMAAPPEDPAGAWYGSAPSDPMHRMAVVRRLPRRVLVIAYLGLGGTFLTNRPHFFNLLATLAPGDCAA